MNLQENTTLQSGKYRIIRVLGQGGFGITYLAEHTMLDKLVAIKEFFPKDYCGRVGDTSAIHIFNPNQSELVEKLKRRFLKEAKNIAKLDHPGIIKIHDSFEENNTAYYVMDYIEGENLSEIVKKNGPLPTKKAISYIDKIGKALDYLHSQKMTHFDVKPANIVIRKNDDEAILIDFGFSKQFDKNDEATSTILPAVSQGFSPIELYTFGEIDSFSPQTDVFSLGATFFFLLTGKNPPASTEIATKGLFIPSSVNAKCAKAIKTAMHPKHETREKDIKKILKDLNKPNQPAPTPKKRLFQMASIFIVFTGLVSFGIYLSSKSNQKTTIVEEQVVLDTISNNRFLTNVAARHYGNAMYWGYLWLANDSILFHPDFIKPGTIVRVPDLKKEFDISTDDPEDMVYVRELNSQLYKKFHTYIDRVDDSIIIENPKKKSNFIKYQPLY